MLTANMNFCSVTIYYHKFSVEQIKQDCGSKLLLSSDLTLKEYCSSFRGPYQLVNPKNMK